MKISATAARTLATIIAKGGELNGYAGVKGVDMRCEGALRKAGLLERVICETHGPLCSDWTPGNHPADSTGDTRWYARIRVTEAGRAYTG